MAETTIDEEPSPYPSTPSSTSTSSMLKFLTKLMSKRRTWACLFVFVCTILISLFWNFLKTTLSWYESTSTTTSPSSSSCWPPIYASVALGVAFGMLLIVAAMAVAVPATLVTWITVLVLLTFFGKPRRALIIEAKSLTADITGFAVKVLIREGNIVAALCAVLGYFALVRKGRQDVDNFSTN